MLLAFPVAASGDHTLKTQPATSETAAAARASDLPSPASSCGKSKPALNIRSGSSCVLLYASYAG
jgi:hypothetical protein